MHRAYLLTSQSNASGLSEQCSGFLKALQLESKSIALGVSKQCSWRHRALLWHLRSIAAIIVPLCCVTKDTHLLNSVNDEVFIFLNDTNLMRAFDSHVIEGILIPVVAQRLYTDNLMPIAGAILVAAAEIPRG